VAGGACFFHRKGTNLAVLGDRGALAGIEKERRKRNEIYSWLAGGNARGGGKEGSLPGRVLLALVEGKRCNERV